MIVNNFFKDLLVALSFSVLIFQIDPKRPRCGHAPRGQALHKDILQQLVSYLDFLRVGFISPN